MHPPHLARFLPLLATCAFAGEVLAQMPTDAVIVLEATSSATELNYRLVDLFGRGNTPVRGQSAFLQPPPVSVATDPAQAGAFWFQANPSSLAGTWRCDVGSLATITQSTWGAWLRTAGERVECGLSTVFTLRAGVVEACAKAAGAPQTPTTLFTLPQAIDLAVQEPLLYVASFDPNTPSALVEYHLTTGTQRIVGSYLGVRAIAVSPVTGELLLGTVSGDLVTVDAANGAVTSTTPATTGPLVAVGYSRFGTKVYATSNELWSELGPQQPIYTSTRPITDLGVTRLPTASVVAFGNGCGLGTTARWAATGLPLRGNSGFQLQLRGGVANAFTLFALGTSRAFASQLGVPLPFDLQPLGAPGCPLLVDPQTSLFRTTNVAGEAVVPVPIPNAQSLVGFEFAAQWLLPDPSSGSLGLAVTEGAAFVVR
jgi:hypothetical protein